jgi:hypothetical protein
MNFTAKEQAYFKELAAQIVSTLGADAAVAFQADPVGVLTAAHEQRQEFVWELINGRTDRARMARIVLTAEVYIAAVTIETRRHAVEHCEYVAERTYRKTFGFG